MSQCLEIKSHEVLQVNLFFYTTLHHSHTLITSASTGAFLRLREGMKP